MNVVSVFLPRLPGCAILVLSISVFMSSRSLALEVSPYTDTNRELFRGVQSSGAAGADAVYCSDGALQAWPSVFAFVKSPELHLSYAGFYGNTFSTSSVSFVRSGGHDNGFGISLGYLHVPDIQITDALQSTGEGAPIYDPSLITSASSSEIALRFGYGHLFRVLPMLHLSLGAAVSGSRKNLVGATGYGLGLDASGMACIEPIGLRLGIIMENTPANYTYWGRSFQEQALSHVRFAVGWSKEAPYLYGRLRAFYTSPDFLANEAFNGLVAEESDSIAEPVNVHPSRDPLRFVFLGRWGGEYLVQERVALRLGLAGMDRIAFGAGAHLLNRALTLDFAYILHQLNGTYQVGMSFRL